MLDNHNYEYSPHCSRDARFEYQAAIKMYNTNFRKYLTGSKYRSLYEDTYRIIEDEHFKIVVKLEDGTFTEITVTTLPSNHELINNIKDFCIKYFKNRKNGNCRVTSGDGGTMNVIGMNAKLKRGYNINDDLKSDLRHVCEMASEYYKSLFEYEASTMIENSTHHERIKEMKDCIVSEFLVSKDLVNAAHLDSFDTSMSIATWVEEIENDAKGWNFILPNVTSDGEKGTVIPLSHGKIITWDGTIIFHCSSVNTLNKDNHVYGFFFGVK